MIGPFLALLGVAAAGAASSWRQASSPDADWQPGMSAAQQARRIAGLEALDDAYVEAGARNRGSRASLEERVADLQYDVARWHGKRPSACDRKARAEQAILDAARLQVVPNGRRPTEREWHAIRRIAIQNGLPRRRVC